jgi:peptidyl-prolyl cis-trans isomerase A (cyclophilin A)
MKYVRGLHHSFMLRTTLKLHLSRTFILVSLLLAAMMGGLPLGCKDQAALAKVRSLEEENKVLSKKAEVLAAKNDMLQNSLAKAQQKTRDLEEKAREQETQAKIADTARELGLSIDEKLYATFKTNKGTMVAELFWKKVPNTVLNFVRLAEGKKEWTDPKTGKITKRPLYNRTIFHRVIPKFMIQGGDPVGSGLGGPGYTFADEFHPSLKHSSAGILSMANRGADTNGSQFFITAAPTPHLDQRHSIFGKLNLGLEVVHQIAAVEKAGPSQKTRPKKNVVLQQLRIGRGKPRR